MQIKVQLISIIFFLLIGLPTGYCQDTRGLLEVQKFLKLSPDDYINRLQIVKTDTGRVNLLVKISSIYWRLKSPSNNFIDSSLAYSRSAFNLSTAVNYTEGHNESSFLICKALIEKEDLNGVKQILIKVYREQHVRLLLVIGEHYCFWRYQHQKNLEKAFPYINQAIGESQKLNSVYWKATSLELMAKYLLSKGDNIGGQQFFSKIIKEYNKLGDKVNEAKYWSEQGMYLPDTSINHGLIIHSFEQAINIYKAINDKKSAGDAMLDMGDITYAHDLDSAITMFLETIRLFKAAGKIESPHVYLSLSNAYHDKGDLNQALACALLALKTIEDFHHDTYLSRTYVQLGDIYQELEEFNQSTYYYKLAIDFDGTTAPQTYRTIKRYVDGLVAQKRALEALKFIQKFEKIRAPSIASEQAILAYVTALAYYGLGNRKLAEFNYLKMISFYEADLANKGKQIFYAAELDPWEAYYAIAKFYTEIKRFETGAAYLQKLSAYKNVPSILKKDILYLKFKTDSASGNFLKAISNLERSSSIKDSIYRLERLNELMGMRVRFETEQKDKDLKLLQKEGQIQKKDLERARQMRLFTYAGLVGLLLLLSILYNRYRLKQKSNLLLKEQKDIIDSKNISLTHLVQEKEWLLKEVHHRVKNNLQIITGLLNSQSNYLRDEAALNAIADSKNRVRAMSLIHQKLYMSDKISSIYMPEYLIDLINYLKESYDTGLSVIFEVDIPAISLDIAYAIPVGLIVNETITNSLKYAFPHQGDHRIKISLNPISRNDILLSIVDNGVGLPADIDIKTSQSFGMVLIKGMVDDLDGQLSISSAKGTQFKITFGIGNLSNDES